jgi:hypothetical protein
MTAESAAIGAGAMLFRLGFASVFAAASRLDLRWRRFLLRYTFAGPILRGRKNCLSTASFCRKLRV